MPSKDSCQLQLHPLGFSKKVPFQRICTPEAEISGVLRLLESFKLKPHQPFCFYIVLSNTLCGLLVFKQPSRRLSKRPMPSVHSGTHSKFYRVSHKVFKINVFLAILVVTLALPSTFACTLGTVRGCSTAIAAGLTSQLVAELNLMGISFAALDDPARFVCSTPCVPCLETAARDSLASATASVGDFITLNSAYRSSAQQYFLYSWWLGGVCDIPIADIPGTSRHEGGLAVHTNFYSFWSSTLSSYSWVWAGSEDAYHFRYAGGGVEPQSLLVFQGLWNRDNPSGTISENRVYVSNTAARHSAAPCGGW